MKFSNNGILYLALVVIAVITAIAAVQIAYVPEEPNLALEELRIKYAKEDEIVKNHQNYEILQQEFKTPQEVTKACISCHTDRHNEVMASAHWNWDRISYVQGKGLYSVGKKNVLNNFCISVGSNEQLCSSCHTGFGLDSIADFDFDNPENVDCLACHADGSQYFKETGMAGMPADEVSLSQAAQSVRSPQLDNCGTCHFYGGGGNNVKHGDLEEALYNADRDLDVHMAKNGVNMTCVDCHTADNHEIKGRLYSVSSANVNRALCEDCHTNTPHLSEMLNTHTAKISCQTCHIPEYAKANPTKMEWRWSEAGLHMEDGKPITIDNELGEHVYMSKKGSFVWGRNLQPDYMWFNGNADHMVIGDKVDTTLDFVQVNKLFGSHDDPESKIVPVKIHKGDQIYDTKYLTMIQPKLYPSNKEDSVAFWKNFDWHKAAKAGMDQVGMPYSGEHAFVETEMYWPINHMVAPASESLQCADCHTQSEDGRLANLTGFYLPGRDHSDTFDSIGLWMIWLSVIGIGLHAGFRVFSHIREQENIEMTKYEDFEEDEKN